MAHAAADQSLVLYIRSFHRSAHHIRCREVEPLFLLFLWLFLCKFDTIVTSAVSAALPRLDKRSQTPYGRCQALANKRALEVVTSELARARQVRLYASYLRAALFTRVFLCPR